MTQEDLAEITGIPAPTIRAIEAGKRQLTEATLKRIRETLYADWTENGRQWTFAWTGEPFSRDSMAKAEERDLRHPYTDSVDIHAACLRIFSLFDAVPRRRRTALLFSVLDALEDVRKRFGLERARKIFAGTTPQLRSNRKLKLAGDTKILKDEAYFRRYSAREIDDLLPSKDAGGVLDFRSRRGFNPSDFCKNGVE